MGRVAGGTIGKLERTREINLIPAAETRRGSGGGEAAGGRLERPIMVTMTRRCPGQRSGLPERPRPAGGRAICRVAWMPLVRADGS